MNDLDEMGLLGAIRSLQQGKDMAGFELDGTPSFTVGCALVPCADDKTLERELERTRKKVEAGAGFVVCPPVFDLDHFASMVEKARGLGAPLIPTIFLLKTVVQRRE